MSDGLPTARLLVDTAAMPLSLGFRSAMGLERQLLFRHEDHHLDVMFQEAGAAGSFIWGQIVTCSSGVAAVDARVDVQDDAGSVVASAWSDEYGEFSVTAPWEGSGALAVAVADQQFACAIPPAPTDDESSETTN